MAESIAFYTLAAFILGFAVLVVTTKDTVHSVLFLVLDFLFVAALYVLLGAQFLAAIQILVYAGGIVVLYLFVVMLVNLKRPPEEYRDPRRRSVLGFGLSAAVLAELGLIAFWSRLNPAPPLAASAAAADIHLAKTLRLTLICLTGSGPVVRIRAFQPLCTIRNARCICESIFEGPAGYVGPGREIESKWSGIL